MKQFTHRSTTVQTSDVIRKKEEEMEKLKKEMAAMEKRYKELKMEVEASKENRRKTLKFSRKEKVMEEIAQDPKITKRRKDIINKICGRQGEWELFPRETAPTPLLSDDEEDDDDLQLLPQADKMNDLPLVELSKKARKGPRFLTEKAQSQSNLPSADANPPDSTSRNSFVSAPVVTPQKYVPSNTSVYLLSDNTSSMELSTNDSELSERLQSITPILTKEKKKKRRNPAVLSSQVETKHREGGEDVTANFLSSMSAPPLPEFPSAYRCFVGSADSSLYSPPTSLENSLYSLPTCHGDSLYSAVGADDVFLSEFGSDEEEEKVFGEYVKAKPDSDPSETLEISSDVSSSNAEVLSVAAPAKEPKSKRTFLTKTTKKHRNLRRFESYSKEGRVIESSEPLDAWNLRFQKCIERLQSLDASCPIEERIEANIELMHLGEDFVHASRTVGKIIISEVYVPVDKKTVRPSVIGGRAGGEKYIVHNILFKFAVDSSNLFDGSNWAARKVANHELKGLMSYFSLGLKDVYTPLMALVDYRGFRLVAMSVLPVNWSTLIYGTNDAGVSIEKSNRKFNGIMLRASVLLNLKPHLCGADKAKAKVLCSAADIEGHLGTDGKFYLLDFSRTMPPVRPSKKFYNGHLHRLLRSELVVKYPKRLCSDAFSGFIMHDPNYSEHNKEIDEASDFLMKTVIPAFAKDLLLKVEKVSDFAALDVAFLLHKSGINLRYIGSVVRCFKPMLKARTNTASIANASAILLLEATARVVKNELNALLRHQMQELKLPLDVPYRKIVIEFFNSVFGMNSDSVKWWKDKFPSRLEHFFNVSWFPFSPSNESAKEWRVAVFGADGRGKEVLFKRIVKLTGLYFSTDTFGKFSGVTKCSLREPLELLDLEEMGDRVKNMDIVSSSQGNFYYLKSLQESDDGIAMHMLEQAIDKYENALSHMPSNKESLLHCAVSWFRLLLFRAEIEKWTDDFGVYFDAKDPDVQRTEKYLLECIESSSKDASILCLYAQFLDKTRDFAGAEEYFLASLEADSQYALAMVMYGNFLILRGHPETVTNPFLRSPSLAKPAISLLTLQPLGGSVRIFLETETFRTYTVKSSTSSLDMHHMLVKSLPHDMQAMSWGLYLVDFGKDPNSISTDDVASAVRSKERSMELLLPNSHPYILLQRPNNQYGLYFQRISSKRAKAFDTIRSEEEYFSAIGSDLPEEALTTLLLFHERFTTSERLLRALSEQYSEKKTSQMSAIQQWLSFAPYDVEAACIPRLVAAAAPSKAKAAAFAQLECDHMQFLKERTDIFDWCGPLLRGMDNPKQLRELTAVSDIDISGVALHLRAWALTLFVFLDIRELMFLRGPRLQAVLLHFHELSRWARDSIADVTLPPEESFRMFKFFSKLAHGSFSILDHYTASALLDGLTSPLVQKAAGSWLGFGEYEYYKEMWRLPEVDAAMIVLPARSETNRRSVYLEIQRSRYDELAAAGKTFLCAIHPLLYDMEDLGLSRPDATTGALDVTKTLEAFERAKGCLQGCRYKALEKGVFEVMPTFVTSLANGPLHFVSQLPLLSLTRPGWSMRSSIVLSPSTLLRPEALVQIILQHENFAADSVSSPLSSFASRKDASSSMSDTPGPLSGSQKIMSSFVSEEVEERAPLIGGYVPKDVPRELEAFTHRKPTFIRSFAIVPATESLPFSEVSQSAYFPCWKAANFLSKEGVCHETSSYDPFAIKHDDVFAILAQEQCLPSVNLSNALLLKKDFSLVQLILESGVSVSKLYYADWTAGHSAALAADRKILEFLCLHGVDLKAKTKSLSTPLHYFSFRDLRKWTFEDVFFCLHLLGSSRDDSINTQTVRGEAPLHYLLLGAKCLSVFLFLLIHGASMEPLKEMEKSQMTILGEKTLLDVFGEYISWKKAAKSSVSAFQSQLKEGRKECRSLSKWGVKVHDERSVPQHMTLDWGSKSEQIPIADDDIFGDFCPANPKEAPNGRFSFDQQLYRLACSYSVLPSPPFPSSLGISPQCMRIGGKEDFLDCIYYPGWSDVVVRGLLLIHGKYFSTPDLVKKVVSDCKKYSFLLRVLDLWVGEHFHSSLRKHDGCLGSLKRLLQFLEEKLPNVSILEKRVLDSLKEKLSLGDKEVKWSYFLVEEKESNDFCVGAIDVLSDKFDKSLFVLQLNMMEALLWRDLTSHALLSVHTFGTHESVDHFYSHQYGIMCWVRMSVLCDDQAIVEKINRFIELAMRFVECGNYASAKHVFDALSHHSIQRLACWRGAAASISEDYRQLKRLFSAADGDSYSVYRSFVSKTNSENLPLIPCFDVLLDDLRCLKSMLSVDCPDCHFCTIERVVKTQKILDEYCSHLHPMDDACALFSECNYVSMIYKEYHTVSPKKFSLSSFKIQPFEQTVSN